MQHDTCSVLLLHTCDPWCYMIHAHSYLIVTENCIWQFWRQMVSFPTSSLYCRCRCGNLNINVIKLEMEFHEIVNKIIMTNVDTDSVYADDSVQW